MLNKFVVTNIAQYSVHIHFATHNLNAVNQHHISNGQYSVILQNRTYRYIPSLH